MTRYNFIVSVLLSLNVLFVPIYAQTEVYSLLNDCGLIEPGGKLAAKPFFVDEVYLTRALRKFTKLSETDGLEIIGSFTAETQFRWEGQQIATNVELTKQNTLSRKENKTF